MKAIEEKIQIRIQCTLYRSKDPDQNVTDPKLWAEGASTILYSSIDTVVATAAIAKTSATAEMLTAVRKE